VRDDDHAVDSSQLITASRTPGRPRAIDARGGTAAVDATVDGHRALYWYCTIV
jgi:hypothetical protein